MLCDLFHRRRW